MILASQSFGGAPDDTILPPAMHSTEKGRALAVKYAKDLRALNAEIYNCMPWVEVHRGHDGKNFGIGFYKPSHDSTSDKRYVSLHIFIDQDPSPSFVRLAVQDQAAAMYSRYVGPLLRRMARDKEMLADPELDGFTIILEWLKQGAKQAGDRPINATIAVFIDKPVAMSFLSGKTTALQLAGQATILGWDGETPIGRLRIRQVFNDDFVDTYKIKNYQPDPGVTCP